MKHAGAVAFFTMLAIFGAAYVALSLQSSEMGPTAICSPLSGGSEFCYSMPATTFWFIGLWMLLGLTLIGKVVRKIRG